MRTSNTNDFASGSPGYQIYFKSGANAFNLYGNSITFYDFSGGDPNIQNEGAFTNQTVNFPIVDGNANGAFGILNVNLNTATAQGPLTFNGLITSADAAIAVRAINVSGTNPVVFNGPISDFSASGKIALTQLGTSVTTLNATNTFTGNLTISAGTTYADFNFNGLTPSTTTAPLFVNGNLAFTVTPNIIVRSPNGTIAPGTYPLIKYAGTLSGTPPATAFSLPAGLTATIVNNTGNKSIDLNVTVGNAVQWAVGNGLWDINTTANWKNTAGAAANYLDGAAVVLDDTATGASPITVSLNAVVTPASITANLTNKSYTIASNATVTIVGSGPLIKNGPGPLTISTTNLGYTGAITLNGGTLAVGGAASIGSGPITMNNGSTLHMPSTTATGVGNAITVAAGATATNTSGALGSSYSGTVSSGDGTSLLVVGGATSYGAASQMFSGFTGTVQVNSGATLRFSATTGGASFGGSNPTFNINGTLQPRDQAHNSIIVALTGAGSLAGPQTQPTTAGTASYFIGSKNIDSTFSGTISDRTITNLTSVTKIGSATLTLSGNNAYSSTTTVASGTLQMGDRRFLLQQFRDRELRRDERRDRLGTGRCVDMHEHDLRGGHGECHLCLWRQHAEHCGRAVAGVEQPHPQRHAQHHRDRQFIHAGRHLPAHRLRGHIVRHAPGGSAFPAVLRQRHHHE